MPGIVRFIDQNIINDRVKKERNRRTLERVNERFGGTPFTLRDALDPALVAALTAAEKTVEEKKVPTDDGPNISIVVVDEDGNEQEME